MNPRVAVITPSYRNDFKLAQALCESIDEHLRGDFTHHLIVPKRDLALFRPLASAHRHVIDEEGLLKPHGCRHIPLPGRIRIPGLVDIKIREQWWVPGVGRVSGWVIQQLLKLSASDFTDAEGLIFVDSDVQFVKPCDVSQMFGGPQVMLNQHQKGMDLGTHKQWCEIAARLLGVSPALAGQHNYIGNIIAWRRDNLIALRQQIEKTTGQDWRRAVSANKTVSEYILYGVFCAEVLRDAARHSFGPNNLAVSVWVDDAMAASQSIARQFEDGQVALHIQSTIAMSDAQRQALVRRVKADLEQPQAA